MKGGKKVAQNHIISCRGKISTQVSLTPEPVLFTNTQRPQRSSVPYIIKGSETWSLSNGLQPFAALAFPFTPLQVLVVGIGRNWVPEEGGEFVKKGRARMKLPLLPHALDGFPLPLQIHSPPFSVPRRSNRQGFHQRAPLHSGFPLSSAIREHWSESGHRQGSYLIPQLPPGEGPGHISCRAALRLTLRLQALQCGGRDSSSLWLALGHCTIHSLWWFPPTLNSL